MEESNNSSIALKAGTWYVISTVMVRAITVFSTPIFTRLLTTAEYGLVATFTTWFSLLLPVFTMNLTYSIGRAKLDFPDKLDDYIGSMQLLSAIVSAALGVLMIIFINPLSQVMALQKVLIYLLIIYLFFMPAVNFAQSGYRYRYLYRQNIAISWYTILTNIGCSLALILLISGNKTVLRCLGIVLPMVGLSIFFWIRSLKGKHISINREYWRYGLQISLPLVAHTISLHILSTSDRIFITNICGASDTGIYSLAYQVGIILSTVTTAVSEAWLPWFHDNYYSENFDDIKKNTRLIVVFGCYVGLACIALAPELVALLGGKNYASGVYCVPPIVLGIVCQYIYTHYVNIELHLKKTRYVAIGTVTAAVLNIVLNAIFIPRYGFIAAAYTTLFSYLVLYLMHFLITRLILHVKLYSDSFMVLMMIAVAVVGVALMITYEHTVIRYIILAAGFVSFLYVFRSYGKTFMDRIRGKENE
ncbi:MAG: oligosaccharide flippase family protein [Odoribacter sp.]|nr:oligosaccharide flippase family protein [Odoribacter sp.]